MMALKNNGCMGIGHHAYLDDCAEKKTQMYNNVLVLSPITCELYTAGELIDFAFARLK